MSLQPQIKGRGTFMNANILSLAQNALGGDFSKLAGQFLGESPTATQGALGSLLPAVLGSIAQKGATADGASSLMSLMNSANLDTGSLGNIGNLFTSGGAGVTDLMKAGTGRLVPALFGDKSGAVVSALSSSSGIKASSATNLIAMVVPLIFTFLKKMISERGLNAGSLSSLLASQGPNLQGALDSRVTNALGFASPGSFLSSLGGAAGTAAGAAGAAAGAAADTARRAGAAIASGADAAADTARRAGAAVAGGAAAAGSAAYAAGSAAVAEGKSTFARLLPWLIALAVLFILWLLFWPRSTSTTQAPAPTAAVQGTPPAGSMATAAFTGFPAKVYFDTGSAAVGADGSTIITAAADAIKKDNLKVAVTGYTDRTGDTAKNEELAKNRAAAVRDALTAAGVPAGNIDMKPPLFVETGATTSNQEARRVEINKQ
jgi:outer membrane protein OmpA-like peptidoglycan-associated protein